MNTAEIIVITAILTTAICMIAVFAWEHFRRRTRDDHVMYVINQVRHERFESQAILAALDLGIVAYGSDDHLLTANEMARTMLNNIPETFPQFCQDYGEENGMRASILLGNDNVSGVYVSGDRSYRITIKARNWEG